MFHSSRNYGLVAILVCSMILMPLQLKASQLTIDNSDRSKTQRVLDFSAVPALGELRVGESVISLQRVENGFLAREIGEDKNRAFVISDEELKRFEELVPTSGIEDQRPPEIVIQQQGLFGKQELLVFEVRESSAREVSGTLLTPSGALPVSYQMSASGGHLSAAGVGHITEPLLIEITISATVIFAAGCIIHAWITDCANDCSQACSECGATMVSSSEGLCGTCDCTCETNGGLIPYVPEGGSCGDYN